MKIIVRVNSDNSETLDKLHDNMKSDIVVMPQGDGIKVYAIGDNEVIELK